MKVDFFNALINAIRHSLCLSVIYIIILIFSSNIILVSLYNYIINNIYKKTTDIRIYQTIQILSKHFSLFASNNNDINQDNTLHEK